MHQIYFSINWLFSKQSSRILSKMMALIKDKDQFSFDKFQFDPHEGYFSIEYQWHKELLLIDKEIREYITERYRYLLSTVHGLGALIVSISFSFISVIIIMLFYGFKHFPIFILLFLFYLLISVIMGFRYYSLNLIYFQASFFNDFFNKSYTKKPDRERIIIK